MGFTSWTRWRRELVFFPGFIGRLLRVDLWLLNAAQAFPSNSGLGVMNRRSFCGRPRFPSSLRLLFIRIGFQLSSCHFGGRAAASTPVWGDYPNCRIQTPTRHGLDAQLQLCSSSPHLLWRRCAACSRRAGMAAVPVPRSAGKASSKKQTAKTSVNS